MLKKVKAGRRQWILTEVPDPDSYNPNDYIPNICNTVVKVDVQGHVIAKCPDCGDEHTLPELMNVVLLRYQEEIRKLHKKILDLELL